MKKFVLKDSSPLSLAGAAAFQATVRLRLSAKALLKKLGVLVLIHAFAITILNLLTHK